MAFFNPLSNRISRVVFNDHLEPKVGSILYIKLVGVPFTPLGTPEHTGIYVGNNNIVEVHGSGEIRCVTMKQFLDYGSFVRMALYAYVITDAEGKILANPNIAKRAIEKIGTKIEYNLLLNNCHMFTSYCVTGDESNTDSTFLELILAIKAHFKVKTIDWRACVDGLTYEPVEKKLHKDTYSFDHGFDSYYVDYIPSSRSIKQSDIVDSSVIGIRLEQDKTYMYIKYTGKAFFGVWYYFDLPVYLVDKTLGIRYKALEILPFKEKELKAESPRIPKGSTYVARLTFPIIDVRHVFDVVDREGIIYRSIKFKER